MQLKLGYLSGPVDARAIYRSLRDRSQTDLFGTSYMRHFMQVCEEIGSDAVIVTTHGGKAYEERLGRFTILNRPPYGGSGLRYHFRQSRWVTDRLGEMEKRGVGTVILTAAQHHWFMTRPFRARGMRFINSYHCAVRAIGHKRWSVHEGLIRLTSLLHLSHGDPTMVIVPNIVEELAQEAGAGRRRVIQLLPDYPREQFASFAPPPIASARQDRVRVLFAGRVTRNKGVFDIVEMAERLARRDGPAIEFHLHGEGDALEDLRRAAAASPAGSLITIHGFTPGSQLATHYAQSDIVIVPTRSDFDEGVAKSVVEGVLALRPVVTSQACPSIKLLADACVEAKVDDPASYADAIWSLATDPQLVAEKCAAAIRLRELFFDPPERYDRRLKQALALVD